MEAGKLGNFISIYERFARAENKSPRTIESVKYAVTKFDNFLGGCRDVKDVEAEDLREYIRYLQQQPKWFNHPTIRTNTRDAPE